MGITNLHEANVEILCCVSTRQISTNVHVVVSYDSCDDVRRGHTGSSLCGNKLSHFLDGFVDVFNTPTVVRKVVMGNKVNLVCVCVCVCTYDIKLIFTTANIDTLHVQLL